MHKILTFKDEIQLLTLKYTAQIDEQKKYFINYILIKTF